MKKKKKKKIVKTLIAYFRWREGVGREGVGNGGK